MSLGSIVLSSTTAFSVIIKLVCCSNNVLKCSCLNRPVDKDAVFKQFLLDQRQKRQGDMKMTRSHSVGSLTDNAKIQSPLFRSSRPAGLYQPYNQSPVTPDRKVGSSPDLYPLLPESSDQNKKYLLGCVGCTGAPITDNFKKAKNCG